MLFKSSLKFLPVLVVSLVLAAAITTEASTIPGRLASPGDSTQPPAPVAQLIQARHTLFANPAAVYCRDLGYTYQDVDDGAGGQKGVCVMPDSTTCDAWDFIAGKCGAEYSYCAQHGYDLRVADDGQGSFAPAYAVCVDKDGQDAGSAAALDGLLEKVKTSRCSRDASPGGSVEADSLGDSNDATLDAEAQQPEDPGAALPTSFDWRNATYAGVTGNWLTPVKDQGSCGSCWAFGAVGQTEAVLKMASGNPAWNPDLAEEYLVSDCTQAGTCCGGWHSSALDYIQKSGIPDEACMPYVSKSCSCFGSGLCSCAYSSNGGCANSTCSNRCSDYASRLSRISTYGLVGATATAIKQALVTYGPISVAFDVGDARFDANGVAQCDSASQVDHVVDLVGYDDAGGYWIARNSWGSTWNGDGYFKIGYGQCLVENYAYYAVAPSVVSGVVYNSSGTGLSGVKMGGLPHEPITDSNGFFSDTVPYNWSGTVTPSKTGFAFYPASRAYTGVLVDQANQSYKAVAITYTISGNTGVAGVTFSYIDGFAKAATSAVDGSYAFTVPYNWSGTVVPSKPGYIFAPDSRTYSNLLADQTGQDYAATATYVISGNAGVAGATLKYTDGSARSVTAAVDGSYSFSVPSNWSGTVIPSKTGYIFSPASRTYGSVLADQAGQDYTATLTYTISGNTGIAGAILSYTDGIAKTVVSDKNGNYTITVPEGWSGTVIPSVSCGGRNSLTRCFFVPSRRTYDTVKTNFINQDYSMAVIY